MTSNMLLMMPFVTDVFSNSLLKMRYCEISGR